METVRVDRPVTLVDIANLARSALVEHGLSAKGWRFEWDRAVRRAGCCRHRDKRITLSGPIFAIPQNRSEARNTILHEIAHALAGPGTGHGLAWRRIAVQIGARPERCHSYDTPDPTIVGVCRCGKTFRRHRMPSSNLVCRVCRGPIAWRRS